MLPLFAVPEAALHAETPQPQAQPKNAVLLDLGLAVVGLAFERTFERQLAFQVTGHVFGTWFGPAVDKPNLSGLGGGVRATWFFTHDAPRGLYVAPFLRVDRVTVDEPGAERAWGYSTGAFAGWSWLFADHVNVRVGGGLQWLAYEVPVGARRDSFRGFFPALDLVVGYAF
ncbi:MAG: hypothetical protein KIT84_05675 [Labilithrix sp.]|nr:hypothetical protein [Labilithrix sp.]MCW5810478.1 hypothetical protein [Labilithrix sp.]